MQFHVFLFDELERGLPAYGGANRSVRGFSTAPKVLRIFHTAARDLSVYLCHELTVLKLRLVSPNSSVVPAPAVGSYVVNTRVQDEMWVTMDSNEVIRWAMNISLRNQTRKCNSQ